MKEKQYKRELAIKYAEKWAYSRNPKYYNFDKLGGDCTNFISQCLYAGCKEMNYNKQNGWYYNSINDRAPSWTGVEFFYNFLIHNKLNGPQGEDIDKKLLNLGDIVQLSFDGITFGHTLLVVNIENNGSLDKIYTSSHTFDSFNRRLSSYNFKKIRFIHIKKIYKY